MRIMHFVFFNLIIEIEVKKKSEARKKEVRQYLKCLQSKNTFETSKWLEKNKTIEVFIFITNRKEISMFDCINRVSQFAEE